MIKQSRERCRREVSLETIASVLRPFRAELSQEQLGAIQTYLFLLIEWNRSISLTAIEDPIEILSRHFGESIFAASFFAAGESRLADVGTGPGFPGLPLKIVCPDMELTLFESNSKKCGFLREVVQHLGLSGVQVVKMRYQDFKLGGRQFDLVCARALGDYHILLPWARDLLAQGGMIVLWVGTEESIRIGHRKEFLWEAPVPIPESKRRVLLIGKRSP